MDRNPRQRVQDDFDRIASWAQFVLQQSGRGGRDMPAVECIYGMGTVSAIFWSVFECHLSGKTHNFLSDLLFCFVLS